MEKKNLEGFALLDKKLLTPVARSELLLADIKEQKKEIPIETLESLDQIEREWNYRVVGVSKTFRELGLNICDRIYETKSR